MNKLVGSFAAKLPELASKAAEKLPELAKNFSSKAPSAATMGSLGGLAGMASAGGSAAKMAGGAALRFGAKLPGAAGGAATQLQSKLNDLKYSGLNSAGKMSNMMGQGVQLPDQDSSVQQASANDSAQSQEATQQQQMQQAALISQKMALFSMLITQQNKGVENMAKAGTGQ